jgi:hypothetical protein
VKSLLSHLQSQLWTTIKRLSLALRIVLPLENYLHVHMIKIKTIEVWSMNLKLIFWAY